MKRKENDLKQTSRELWNPAVNLPGWNVFFKNGWWLETWHQDHSKSSQVKSHLLLWNTLPETNSSHQKIGLLKKKLIFQLLIFRAYVSFREGTSNLSELLAIGHLTNWHDHPRGDTRRDAKPLYFNSRKWIVQKGGVSTKTCHSAWKQTVFQIGTVSIWKKTQFNVPNMKMKFPFGA